MVVFLTMTTCNLCLNIDIAVSKFEESDAYNHFQEILIKQGFEPLNSDSTICFLCKHLIDKYLSFINRILRAQSALTGVLNTRKKITYANLRKLDRSKLNLNTNLNCHSIESYYVGDKPKIEYGNVSEQLEDGVSLAELKIKYESEKRTEGKENNVRSPKKKKNFRSWPLKREDDDVSNQSEYEVSPTDFDTIKQEPDIHYEFVLEKTESQERKKAVKWKYVPMPVEIMPTKLRRKPTKTTSKTVSSESDDTDHEDISKDCNKNAKRKKKNDDDDDVEYTPLKSESESEESSDSEICYDDNGKRMKKKNRRQYPMECEECNFEILSAMKHFHHYLVFHQDKSYPYNKPGKYVCQHCGITKTSKIHLKQHEAVHGPRKIECDVCGKKFFSVKTMRAHRITHNKEYRFICDYCSKGFHFKTELKLHIRVHTGEKPFKCHICGAGFAHKGNVGIHIRVNHQGLKQETKSNKKTTKTKSIIKKASTKSKKKRKNQGIKDSKKATSNIVKKS